MINLVRGENTFPFERKLMSTEKISRIWLCPLFPLFLSYKNKFCQALVLLDSIPPTIQGKQYFQLKCRVHERLIGFRNFAHECLENTTKCFLKTTMDFVIGIGSKEPKHRFSWGLILDKLQLRSILYPLSQQKVS